MAKFIPQYKCARCDAIIDGDPVDLVSETAEKACETFIGRTYYGHFVHDAVIRNMAPAIPHACDPGDLAGVAYFMSFQRVKE